MTTLSPHTLRNRLTLLFLMTAALFYAPRAAAQENLSAQGGEVYAQLKAAQLSGGSAPAAGLVLKRDRAELTFESGTIHFAQPVAGRVTAAVFVGQGRFRAEVPDSKFERENVRRMIGADVVESDFKTAVLRFTDDTFEQLGKNRADSAADANASRLLAESDPRMLKETGANLSARVALSLLNDERPGLFYANFDGGRRGRFSLLIDHQGRIPVANFNLNGGEKGLIFSYEGALYGNDVWMAFYSLEDYARQAVEYSDVHNLIDITDYRLAVDARDPQSRLRVAARLKAQALKPGVRAVNFVVNESLGEFEGRRQKKQMHLRAARAGGESVTTAQEGWEGGFTVFLPRAAAAGDKLEFEFDLEGDFMRDSPFVRDSFYPASNTDWYPRHGYLDRATYEISFRHRKNRRIASVGTRVAEEPDPEDKELLVTRYQMPRQVPIATFAVGPFERHKELVKWEKGWEPTPMEFNSLPGNYMPIKEDFIVAELSNSVRYFSLMFGKYHYPSFSAAYHPFGFGQGLPGLLMIPAADRANKYTYAFIAHETAHQWWGDIVTWRSYRDQWLSEGFAEYSGALYTGIRESADARKDLIDLMRRSLKEPPVTTTGMGKGRLADVGPIILGHRLNTSKTYGAYQALIYNKGALVLRMLHFLLSNPSNEDDKAFFAMMSDFVERHRDGFASTDDFRLVANEHFARSPIGQKYRLKDLNWFFNQWVYQSGLPSYELEYQVQDQPDGSVVVSGQVLQGDVPEDWFMPLPLVFFFNDEQWARGTIHAYGPKTPFQIKLPTRPRKVELDPQRWVLSEKTSTKGK